MNFSAGYAPRRQTPSTGSWSYPRDAKGLIVKGVRKRGIDDPAAVVALGHSFARIGDTILYRVKPVTKSGKVDPATARGIHAQMLIDGEGHMLLSGRYRKPLAGPRCRELPLPQPLFCGRRFLRLCLHAGCADRVRGDRALDG